MFGRNTHIRIRKSIAALVLLTFCSLQMFAQNGPAHRTGPAVISIDLSKQFQRIDNFAASDAWACQFVGNWPEAKKNAIADLLFSRKMLSDGRPQGIGLSMWRFNLGAGSASQGPASGIRDEWRRAESFLGEDGRYDWTRQAGQLWFLRAARQRGVEQFLAFSNSPPVQLTRNRKAFADSAKANLLPDKFADFAAYLAEVTKNIYAKTGILFNYISPVNEPQWDWSDGGQEGTPFSNTDVAGIVKALDTALIKNDLPTKIAVGEAAEYKYLYSEADKPGKGNQITAFFDPASAAFVGGLQRVDKLISGHSYFTSSPFNKAVLVRQQLASQIASTPGLRFWQSEYCILGDNEGEMKGEKRDLGIDAALYMAKVIHNDLVHANASAWQWWLALSPYDYKDGLIYVDNNKTEGNFYPSKMLWALGNYSRFIAPGAVRVNASVSSPSAGLLVSSYVIGESKQLVTVLINGAGKPQAVRLSAGAASLLNMKSFVTSAGADLQPQQVSGSSIAIPARSITTIIADLK